MRKELIQPVLCATFLLAIAFPIYADVTTGKVVGLADGDTITILTDQNEEVRVRLAGIDAPEKGQPFGQASKEHLSQLVFEKRVEIHYLKYDRYGRVIGKVLLDNVDICLSQVRNGLAWHYKKYEAEQTPADRELYSRAETEARTERLGLWTDGDPMAPWAHRALKKNQRSDNQ